MRIHLDPHAMHDALLKGNFSSLDSHDYIKSSFLCNEDHIPDIQCSGKCHTIRAHANMTWIFLGVNATL